MATCAMGMASSVEVLGYLNCALDICAVNGAVNGYIQSSPLCICFFLLGYCLILDISSV